MMAAGSRKNGKMTLHFMSTVLHGVIFCTYVTTKTEEKKVAKELLTAFKVPASELSIVSIS